jgi:hypothetical protein
MLRLNHAMSKERSGPLAVPGISGPVSNELVGARIANFKLLFFGISYAIVNVP